MISWLMLPAMDREIAFKRLPSFTYNIRPQYSPILLGVFKESARPLSTDLYARKNPMDCKGFNKTCHFLASMPQFTKARRTTSQNFQEDFPKGASFISNSDSRRCG